MTTDLWMLVASVGLAWALIMVAATPGILKNGLVWAAGNREDAKPPTGGAARANRAAANMMENLPLFAALVLVVHVSGSANELSAQGSMVFVGGRVAHAACYLIGIPFLRTLSWAVSVAGMFMIASTLF